MYGFIGKEEYVYIYILFKRTTVVEIFQSGISQSTKCVIWNGFCKSSHIISSVIAQYGVKANNINHNTNI